jgi:demethylmenaquinone methyltransferase / 2-methoxy-6-polyprenyl-1,4-benzoquinol methylase
MIKKIKYKFIEMFKKIANKYDLINSILSFGLDKYWRKKFSKTIIPKQNAIILDVATGTATSLISIFKHHKNIKKAIGLDICQEMLNVAKNRLNSKNVSFINADIEDPPFLDNYFDLCTISFGIRNFKDPKEALLQINKILKPNGYIYILEFSIPKKWIFKKLYLIYLRHFLIKIGSFLSKDKKAYNHLSSSIESFSKNHNICSYLEKCNFIDIKAFPITLGIVTIYQAKKQLYYK